MTCSQFLEELSDYLDDEVGSAMRSEFERHIGNCPDCRVIWDTTRKTVRIFKGLEPHPIPRQLESRLLEALARKARAPAS
jgi:anti-sigma factor RsiW